METWTPRIRVTGRPRYLEIADSIANDIKSGLLAAGDRLPPQRQLAAQVGLDFTTVSRGYAEAQRRGLVQSHVGRGTFIAQAPQARATDPRRSAQTDLTMNAPPEPTDPDLIARMREGVASVATDMIALLRYQSPTGTDIDKEAASSWLSMRGMVPALDRVAITPGAHPTILAILTILASAGDTILSEDVTYPGIRAIAARLGIHVQGVASDADGILPDALAAAIETHRPKALYLNPTLNNPTTRTMTAARRQEIASVLIGARLPLIEDDAYGFIPAHPPAPMATLAQGLTWHIGGLAKCVGAGLRLAFTVAPDARAAFLLAQALRTTSGMPSPLSMALMTRWIHDGTADSIRRFVRSETLARQAIAAETLSGATYDSDAYAFNVWLALPEGLGRAELVGRMAGRRIGILSSDAFTVSGPVQERVRICLGGALTRDQLRAELMFLSHSMDLSVWQG